MNLRAALTATRQPPSPLGDVRARRRPAIRTAPPTGGRRALGILALAILFSPALAAQSDPFSAQRRHMIDEQVRRRGIEQRGLLQAMEAVPRHLFVPEIHQPEAYADEPVEIAPGKTISQAYLSARMISLLELRGDEKVLEIGTGSGYDAAVMSRMVRRVYTIEIDGALADRAERTLEDLGYGNVKVRHGDGYRGWPEEAPFDAILVTAAPPRLPEPLIAQLKIGGRMVVPVGNLVQELQVITKTADGLEVRNISLVNLVPMEGEVEREPG